MANEYGYPQYGATPPIVQAPSEEQIGAIIAQAISVATQAGNKAASSNLGQTIKTNLVTYSRDIQETINTLLKNRGAITQQQLNQLDEQTKQAKMAMLEVESRDTFVKYGLYVGIALFAFATLWFLTKDKSQSNG